MKQKRNEQTSKEIASIASKVMKGYKPTEEEIGKMAASLLTQTADKEQSAVIENGIVTFEERIDEGNDEE